MIKNDALIPSENNKCLKKTVLLCVIARPTVSVCTCIFSGVFCPPPKEVDRGHLVAVQRVEYEVGNMIYYLCKKTFLLDGPNKVTCLPNGTWSAVPACRGKESWYFQLG